MTVGEMVLEVKEATGLTFKEMGAKCGITGDSLRRWTKGYPARETTVRDFCLYFKYDIKSLEGVIPKAEEYMQQVKHERCKTSPCFRCDRDGTCSGHVAGEVGCETWQRWFKHQWRTAQLRILMAAK